MLQGVTQDCEGYALAAGMSLGLVMLGKGAAGIGAGSLNLENRLRWASWCGQPQLRTR